MSEPVAVRRLLPGDDPDRFRDLRLEMLADTPIAYIERLADARRHPPSHWADRLRRYTEDPARAMWVAEAPERWVAQAGGFVDHETVAHLVSVYIAPTHRGTGLLERLSEQTFAWARASRCTEIRLEVARENGRAVAAYRRLGFAPTGRQQPHPLFPRDSVEIEMARPL